MKTFAAKVTATSILFSYGLFSSHLPSLQANDSRPATSAHQPVMHHSVTLKPTAPNSKKWYFEICLYHYSSTPPSSPPRFTSIRCNNALRDSSDKEILLSEPNVLLSTLKTATGTGKLREVEDFAAVKIRNQEYLIIKKGRQHIVELALLIQEAIMAHQKYLQDLKNSPKAIILEDLDHFSQHAATITERIAALNFTPLGTSLTAHWLTGIHQTITQSLKNKAEHHIAENTQTKGVKDMSTSLRNQIQRLLRTQTLLSGPAMLLLPKIAKAIYATSKEVTQKCLPKYKHYKDELPKATYLKCQTIPLRKLF